MDAATRSMVRQRAGNRCEYCGILQEQMSAATFHVDHIIPKQHGGSDDPSNLALACYHCNFRKGPNLTGIDRDTGALVPLFHPRQERWEAYFALRETHIVGLTPTGRTTVRVLQMNAVDRVQLRATLRTQQSQ